MITTTKRPGKPAVDSFDQQQLNAELWQQELDQRALYAWADSKGKRPQFAQHFWPRVSMLQQVMQQKEVVWINAAAGYGKTLLMSEYCEAQTSQPDSCGVLWFRCDDKDTPDSHFLFHLLQVVERQLEGIATNALAHWQFTEQQSAADIERVLLLWLQELSTFERPLLLCLDDIHNLSDHSSQQLLIRLINERPANLRIVLASRYLPQALGCLRLDQGISWLGSKELAFNDDQLQRWLMANDVSQAGRLVPALNTRLQGWPAGLSLWLACFRAQGKPSDPPALLAQQEMSDYLQGETLHSLPTELSIFIQQAAVLGSFNEDLLRDCLGDSDYHPLLQVTLSQNLFVAHKPDQPGWYVVHPVMAELLSRQLPQAQRQVLHGRAFNWHKQGKDRIAALYHARQAGLANEVVSWVEAQAEYLIASLDIAAMLEWFDVLGTELLYSSPRLMQIAAWSWLFTQQREKAEPIIQRLMRSNELESYEQAALEGYLARLAGQNKKAEQLCKQALEELPADRFTIRILMISTLSNLCLMNNDADGARIWNRLAQDLTRQFQVPAMEAQVLFEYARIELNRGHINHSARVIDEALELIASHGEECGIARGRLLIYKSFLQWLTGTDRQQLIETMQQGISASIRSHDTAVCYGYALLAMAKAELSQFDQALDILDQAERLMQRWQVGVESYQWLAMIKANIWISQGKMGRAQSYIDEFMKMQAEGPLRSDMFPMLPGFIAATRARMYLLANDAEACIQEADHYQKTNSSSLMSLLMMLIRSVAMRTLKPGESDAQLRQMQQLLGREGINMDLNRWIPNLGRSSDSQAEPELPANVSLSERELEVLRKIDQGLSNQEIADQLFISLHTVKTHARKINVKLSAKSRTQALHRAKELRLI